MRRLPLLLLLLVSAFAGMAQKDFGDLREDPGKMTEPGQKPWTAKPINDRPGQFQFVIVTDRTGGHRPGVFMDAVHKINLLQPEFVMSVGDLIEGYTEDTVELDRQWTEFDGFVEKLEMPFFYVPGNHDITNRIMEDLWLRRMGTTYFHFLYEDVLFLCLNSEDNVRGAGRGTIGDEQYEYVKRVLADHPDVRWTLVFMHQPLWNQDNETLRWPDVEELLRGRPHNVFAGHRHSYASYDRNGGKYIMLATTGGGSSLRGPELGEFDHVVWVTMTEEGPILANLQLEGIWNEDVLTGEGREFFAGIGRGFPVRPLPLYREEGPFTGKKTRIKLTNDRDVPMFVRLEDRFSWTYTSWLGTDTVEVPPNSVAFAELGVFPREGKEGTEGSLGLKATVSYRGKGLPEAGVPFEYRIGPVQRRILDTAEEPVTVDGQLEEWESFPYTISTDDPEDLSARFQLKLGQEKIYVAVEVTDDNIQSDTGTVSWQQDYLAVILNADPEGISALRTGNGWYRNSLILNVSPENGDMPASSFYEDRYPDGYVDWVCRSNAQGYVLEAAIPLEYITERQGTGWRTVRVNVGLQDKDAGEEERPRYSWQPDWRSGQNLVGSGMFFRSSEAAREARPLEKDK